VLCYTEEEPSHNHMAHGMYLPCELSQDRGRIEAAYQAASGDGLRVFRQRYSTDRNRFSVPGLL
jgi:hypothetical protein